jgi:hypothetical protein
MSNATEKESTWFAGLPWIAAPVLPCACQYGSIRARSNFQNLSVPSTPGIVWAQSSVGTGSPLLYFGESGSVKTQA